MNRVRDLAVAAGIDPRQGPAETAALMARRFPLRTGAGTDMGPEEIVESGWCSGLEAFADVLSLVTGRPCRWGTAFGARWPWFEAGGAVVAPGLPVRVGPGGEEPGPDGAYTRDGDSILREAAGRRDVFLAIEETGAREEPDFTLLWFSDSARFLLRDTGVEIEDLFSKTRCPIDQNGLENILVRGQRIDREVIEDLPLAGEMQPTTVEVAREQGTAKIRWREPESFLESRIDVDDVKTRGGRAVIKDVRGETVEFVATQQDSGWALERERGRFPYDVLSLQSVKHHLVLKATIAPGHDLLSSGTRGRFVFDLTADLMAFQKS